MAVVTADIFPHSTHGNTPPPTTFEADSLDNEESVESRAMHLFKRLEDVFPKAHALSKATYGREVGPFSRGCFFSGSGSLPRVTRLFLAVLGFRAVLIFRRETATEWFATLHQTIRLKHLYQ